MVNSLRLAVGATRQFDDFAQRIRDARAGGRSETYVRNGWLADAASNYRITRIVARSLNQIWDPADEQESSV